MSEVTGELNLKEIKQRLAIETAGALPEFEELLDLAIESCLSDRAVFDKHFQRLGTERAVSYRSDLITSRLGLWGIREALEYSVIGKLTPSSEYADNSDDEESIPYPRAYEPQIPPDPFVQLKIEAFGAAIIEEAFTCLGSDAEAKIKEFQEAKTQEDKREVLNWLLKRLVKIRKHRTLVEEGGAQEPGELSPGETDNRMVLGPGLQILGDGVIAPPTPRYEEYYHPLKLSPKMIGAFPNLSVTPSCLGVSIITAAFFERAGVPYLHAGVIQTADTDIRTIEKAVIRMIADFSVEHKIHIPLRFARKLRIIDEIHHEALNADTGFHAAVLANIDEAANSWVQLDPNFNSNKIVSSMASLQIKEIYEGLKSLEPTAKGIESRFIDTHVTRLYELYRYAYNLTETPKPLTEIKEFLRQLDPEQIVEELMAYCFGPVLKQEDDHGIYVDRLMANAMKKKPNGETRKIIANQLSLAVRGLGIPDLDRNIEPIEITERLKTDSRYLHKIAKNIQVLPLLGELRLINYFSALITSNDYVETHAVSELGLPAYRIGAAVLSDFAVYTGDKLPPSFWLAHWTSHISFAEHSKTDSKIQNEALRAASLYVDDILLTYSSISDIVCDVLERG